jgi:hypothetical protein
VKATRWTLISVLLFTVAASGQEAAPTEDEIAMVTVKYIRAQMPALYDPLTGLPSHDHPAKKIDICQRKFLECFPEGWSYSRDPWNRNVGGGQTWCTIVTQDNAEPSAKKVSDLVAAWLRGNPKIKNTRNMACKLPERQEARGGSREEAPSGNLTR